jgi:hypothetical protein
MTSCAKAIAHLAVAKPDKATCDSSGIEVTASAREVTFDIPDS